MDAYKVFEEKHGIVFAPTGAAWEPEFTSIVRTQRIRRVRLSGYLGWRGTDLRFLEDLGPLDDFVVMAGVPTDPAGLYQACNIRRLYLDGSVGKVDFTRIKGLRELDLGRWSERDYASVLECRKLESLGLTGVPWDDLQSLSVMSKLKTLAIMYSRLIDLKGLESLVALERLYLVRCNKLSTLKGAEGCRILFLQVEGAKELSNLSALEELKKLRTLYLHDCPRIASLGSLTALPELSTVDLRGQTNIRDGNLGPLLTLPKLAYAFTVDRRHYSIKDSQLPKDLGSIFR